MAGESTIGIGQQLSGLGASPGFVPASSWQKYSALPIKLLVKAVLQAACHGGFQILQFPMPPHQYAAQILRYALN